MRKASRCCPPEQISTSELYNASLRNVSTLVSRDLDGDGIVEIPTQPDEAGLLNLSQSRRMDFIVWMDYTSPEPEKSFGLLDEESSCYIELPAEWEGNLMLTDSAEGEEAVELHTVDEGKLVLTMRLVPSSESAAGWTRLGVVASRQMQAKVRAGRGAEGSELSTVPVVVPVELMMPLSFAEVYRMQAGCSEVKCFSVCSWAEGEGRKKIWRS